MAVENKYVDANVEAGGRYLSMVNRGDRVLASEVTFEVAAADSDGSVYRLLKGVPTQYRLLNVEIFNDAITGGTDYDLGFYKTQEPDGTDGEVLDADLLVNGADLSTGHAVGSPLTGLSAVDLADLPKPIYELLSGAGLDQFTDPASVDIALTANTVGTAAGTITVKFWFLAPVA